MGRIRLAGLFLALCSLAGCAVVQKPIPASAKLFDDRTSTVAVAVQKLPEPNQNMIGAQGILDYAINKANAQAIVERLQRQDFSLVKGLPQELAKGLESRQVKVVLVAAPVDTEQLKKFTEGSGDGIAEMDYRPLAKQYGADRLLLVAPRWLGTSRSYYGFMPLGAPEGYVSLVGQLIDLHTNRLQWYEPVTVNTPVTGEWDDAPEYSNLMKSVDASTRAATSKLRAALFIEQMTTATGAAVSSGATAQ
ncbi:hypothetical protein [Cupriavidus sp. UME77]|uniref:hypothetical protein n=1 Tax=Cupriavidus sp. UME77 TaxID=1862321 RepID=UPI001603A3EB|nr:hypothetical protein [Cupriavidus sp. UME77]